MDYKVIIKSQTSPVKKLIIVIFQKSKNLRNRFNNQREIKRSFKEFTMIEKTRMKVST